MDWVERIVAEFGQQIGLPELSLDENRRLRMDSDDGSGLGFIDAPDLPIPELLVYIARPAGYLSSAQIESAIHRAHYRFSAPWSVQAAISPKELIFGARIRHRSLSMSSLREALQYLKQLHSGLS